MKIFRVGKRYLGSALGTDEFVKTSLKAYVSMWTDEVDVLSVYARTQPQASLAVFTRGLVEWWSYFSKS